MRSSLHLLPLLAAGLIACGPPPVPRVSRAGGGEGSPLGPSYVLLPLPGDDDALLGRVLTERPDPGRSLEELARPNPCADKLSEAKKTPQANTFEDAQELSGGASIKAMLGTFGFAGDVDQASHFFYKIETSERIARADTTDYVACCKEKGCGYGYVSALVYGDGEYATGSETKASASVDVVVGGGSGQVQLKTLHKRKVHGFIAALVTITDASKASAIGPLGAAVQEPTIPDTVKEIYERSRLKVDGNGTNYVILDGSGNPITENDFAERFRDATGSTELDPINRRRNTPKVAVLGALTAASAGLTIYGILHLKRYCKIEDYPDSEDCSGPANETFSTDRYQYFPQNKTTSVPGIIMTAGGGLATAGFGAWLLVSLLRPDGSPSDHYLTDRDALLYVSRYNRALLRKTVRDVEKTHKDTSSLWLMPYATPQGVGLWGRF